MNITITGHRKIGHKIIDDEYSPWLTKTVDEIVARAIEKDGESVFLCGGALGSDRMIAWQVIKQEGIVDLYLPYLGFDDGHSQEQKQDLMILKAAARSILYLDEPGYDRRKLLNRNLTMLDQSSAVIAIMAYESSGTYHCVNEALNRGMPVYLIDPVTEKAEWRKRSNVQQPDRLYRSATKQWIKRTVPGDTRGDKVYKVHLVSDLDPHRDELLSKWGVLAQPGHWLPEYLQDKYPTWEEGGGGDQVEALSDWDRDLYMLHLSGQVPQDQGDSDIPGGDGGEVPLHHLSPSGNGDAQRDNSATDTRYARLAPGEVYRTIGPYTLTKPLVTSDEDPTASMSLSGLEKRLRELPEEKKKAKRKDNDSKIRQDQEKLKRWQQQVT